MSEATVMNKKLGLLPLAVMLPFVLSAALYLSAVFAVFAAIPMVYAYVRFGRWGGLAASISNLAIVWLLLGQFNAAVFFITACVLALVVSELIQLKSNVNTIVIGAGAGMLFSLMMLTGSYSLRHSVNPIEKVQAVVSDSVDKVVADIEKYKATTNASVQDFEKILMDPQATKKSIVSELFSVLGIIFLMIALANFLLLMKLNPFQLRASLGLDKNFFKKWKVPEYFVWPAIACGFCLVVEIPFVSKIALNLFKILMAVYAIQGLAILSTMFDSWKVKSWLRPIGYIAAIMILLPMIISLGFFDLWFDLRGKVKK